MPKKTLSIQALASDAGEGWRWAATFCEEQWQPDPRIFQSRHEALTTAEKWLADLTVHDIAAIEECLISNHFS